MASYCVTKNNIDSKIEEMTTKIDMLKSNKVFENYMSFSDDIYYSQLVNCNKSDKLNIDINLNGLPYLSNNDDCIFQSHYSSLEDKILDKVEDEVLSGKSRHIKDFNIYVKKNYNTELNNKNIRGFLNELKSFNKYLYYKLFEKCSIEIKKEFLSNAEIAYLEHLDMLQEELLLLQNEKDYF